MRQEVGVRLVDRVYGSDDKPSKVIMSSVPMMKLVYSLKITNSVGTVSNLQSCWLCKA